MFRNNRPLFPELPERNSTRNSPLTNQDTSLISATGKIGAGLIRAQLDAGAKVVIVSRNDRRCQETKDAFPEEADRITTIRGDVGALASAEQVAADIADQVGQIDHVVNGLNAWMQSKRFWEVDEKTWERPLGIITPTSSRPALSHPGSGRAAASR